MEMEPRTSAWLCIGAISRCVCALVSGDRCSAMQRNRRGGDGELTGIKLDDDCLVQMQDRIAIITSRKRAWSDPHTHGC